MPTHQRDLALRPERVSAVIDEACFQADSSSALERLPQPPPERPLGRIGLEVELFPLHGTSRLPLEGNPSVRGILDAAARTSGIGQDHAASLGLPTWPTEGGGYLTVEPGAQVEYAGPPASSVNSAITDAESVVGWAAHVFASHGVTLAAAGVDTWGEGIEQQLATPRYPAMDAFFQARGSDGSVMMRHTAALQVNLDLGTGAEVQQRWDLANLLAPILTAAFANSPGERGNQTAVSSRSLVWQQLDPTRTGLPGSFIRNATASPPDQMAAAALNADMLLFKSEVGAEPGRRGFTFDEWMRVGHPHYGWPTEEDLRYHLTTLFFEVRPRGWLEIRTVDALPAHLRAIPVTLLAGALYDPLARELALSVLEPRRRDMVLLLRRAATQGVSDGELCALSVEVLSYALQGALRLGDEYVSATHVTQAEQFIDDYTMRGRCPADELSRLLRESSEAGLDWVAEPVPTSVEAS